MSYNNKFYLGDYVREIEIVDLMNDEYDDRAWINSVNVIGETPLHIAARRRILDLFECMLPHCNDIEACDDQGNTILHQLVDSSIESDEEHKRKRIDLLRDVLSMGADVNRRNKLGWTSDHLAAKHSHVAILSILKEAGADFNLRTEDGETVLLIACKHMYKFRGTSDELDIVDFLMSDEDRDVNAVDCEGYSALHYAVEWCSARIVVKLLEAGADVHRRTEEHKLTALHLAAKRKNPTKLDILTKAGASVTFEEEDELTPLHLALLESSVEIVERLVNCGSDLDCPDAILQFTPLHVAVYQQREDLVKLLVNEGADVDGSGEDGSTCLHLAAILGDVKFTRILIDHGADVNCRDKNDLTPLHLAIRKSYGVDGLTGAEAVMYGKQSSLIGSLLSREHTPTDKDYEAVVRLLIERGADVNIVTERGENLVYVAVEANDVDILKMLVDMGVDVDCATIASEYTPLHLAICDKHVDAVAVLVNAGAAVNVLTEDGKSPLHLALESNCAGVLRMLVRAGAKLHCEGKACLYTLLGTIVQSDEDICDFEETPLLRAIDSLDNVEMKRSVLHLCALVSTGHENTCDNFHVTRNFPYNFKSLLMIGLYVNDFDVFCKLVFDTYHERSPSDNTKYGLFRFMEDLRLQGDECHREDVNLKKYSISDDVSLYDLLHMEFKRRRMYTNLLDLCEIESKFPVSYDLILARVRETAIRKVLLEITQVALCRLTNAELPVYCIEEIFANLEIVDMIATVEAAEL